MDITDKFHYRVTIQSLKNNNFPERAKINATRLNADARGQIIAALGEYGYKARIAANITSLDPRALSTIQTFIFGDRTEFMRNYREAQARLNNRSHPPIDRG